MELAKRVRDTTAARIHADCNWVLAQLRSGSRRRSYRGLRASLREHRAACARRL